VIPFLSSGIPVGLSFPIPPGKQAVREEGRGRPLYALSPVCTQSSPEQQLLSLYVIYTVGYALSFSALVIASAILLGFR